MACGWWHYLFGCNCVTDREIELYRRLKKSLKDREDVLNKVIEMCEEKIKDMR